MFKEEVIENMALDWFSELDYEIIEHNDLEFERKSINDAILLDRLHNSLSSINKDATSELIDAAIGKLLYPDKTSLIENNKLLHSYFTNGVEITYRTNEGSRTQIIKIFDFDNIHNNDFAVANQFTIKESEYMKRPDIVIFINGIPISVFELKSLEDENTSIHNAFNQIKTYQNTITKLFNYNVFNVISDGLLTKVGTITSNEERYMEWKSIDGTNLSKNMLSLEVTIKGMFAKKTILDLIKNFVLFQSDGQNHYKIIAAYHQYFATNKAIQSTKDAIESDGRIGVIWHTQGSGKSLTMVFYSAKIMKDIYFDNPTIVVITDRNDLDDQLFETFSKSFELIREQPIQAESRLDLHNKLNNRQSGGVIFTTIHKFMQDDNNSIKSLTNRKNVVVIADEAHRSQYGFIANYQNINDDFKVSYGYAKYMRDSLPNASYIGFTGTPIANDDKNTQAVFGNYIDIYDMTQAVQDGMTVKIYYESRIIELDLIKEKEEIDFEYEEITLLNDEKEKEKLKRKWTSIEAAIGAEARVKKVALDIVEHFEKRQETKPTKVGKAMIVAVNRLTAVNLYNEIIKLRPNWHSNDISKGKIKVVMTGSSSDPEILQPHVTTKQQRTLLDRRIKDDNDELEIVIVVDMWLTGFDVPSLHTMYIDKPMKDHNLMQAIARVNRVYMEKEGGLIVDYIGIANNLKDALKVYTDQDRQNTGIDTNQIYEVLREKITIIRELIHKSDYKQFFETNDKTLQAEIMLNVADDIIADENLKSDFQATVKELLSAYTLCATDERVKQYHDEIGFYKSVRTTILKFSNSNNNKKTETQLDYEMNQLISKSLKTNEIIDILSNDGINKDDISIFSDEFLNSFKNIKQKNIAEELLKGLIRKKINTMRKQSVVQYKRFSEMLEATIQKYNERVKVREEDLILNELIKIAKEIHNSENEEDNVGLTKEEYAFYLALADNEDAKEMMGSETLKKIAIELTQKIKETTSKVDWNLKDSIRAQMRIEIRQLLKKYNYPPTQHEKSINLIMEQTYTYESNV